MSSSFFFCLIIFLLLLLLSLPSQHLLLFFHVVLLLMFPSPCRTIHISVMHNICKINSQMSRMFIHRLYSLHKLLTLVILKELVHPKMTIFQTSKTFVGTQIKILFMHSERSLTLHRQQGSLHVAKKKVVIFVFFTHKKYSHSFIKLLLNHRIILTISWLHF